MGCRPACVGELSESMFWHSDEWVRGVDALGLWIAWGKALYSIAFEKPVRRQVAT